MERKRSSVVEQKLVAVEQRPPDIFECGRRTLSLPVDQRQRRLQFFSGRLPRHRRKKEMLHLLPIGQ